MSGEGVPYYLRPNKAVDRLLFVEALRHIDHWKSISKYSYVAMGGRLLEDFRLVHSEFSVHNMHSFEEDGATLSRQEYNKPYSFITCHHLSSDELIADFETFSTNHNIKNCIVWLDYAAANGRQVQLREYGALLRKLNSGDVVKLTLNAAPHTLGGPALSKKDFQVAAFAKLKNDLGKFFDPNAFDETHITNEGVAKILADAAKYVVTEAMAGSSNVQFQPLGLFRYSDGPHQMLTISGILVDKGKRSNLIKKSKLESWPYFAPDWEKIHLISVPDLSLKERQFIDKLLFTKDVSGISAELPFQLDGKIDKSKMILENYVEHYRRYPTFIRALF